jgi:two-component system, chemotaxis family, chemotaxis protein CheY
VLSSIEAGTCQDADLNTTSRSCLIADDSAPVRRIARRVLVGLGFDVDEAENGEIALEKCRIRMPDVILLDWNMPVMDGLEFLRALRRTRNGDVPAVIFCTTETDVEHIQSAIAAGADEYLMKPFDRESLSAKLAGVVSRN